MADIVTLWDEDDFAGNNDGDGDGGADDNGNVEKKKTISEFESLLILLV